MESEDIDVIDIALLFETTLRVRETMKEEEEDIKTNQVEDGSVVFQDDSSKLPNMSDIIESIGKLNLSETGGIPRSNIMKLDMSFLQDFDEVLVSSVQKVWVYLANKPQIIIEDYLQCSENNPLDIGRRIINKSWCKNATVIYEERYADGKLIDIYRVSKELRRIKLHGKISKRWEICLDQMKVGETKWFKVSSEINENKNPNSFVEKYFLFVKIHVLSVQPLADQKTKAITKTIATKGTKEHTSEIEEFYFGVREQVDTWNEQGKLLLKKDKEKAGKLFKRAFCEWRSIYQKIVNTLSSERIVEHTKRLSQFYKNYEQTLSQEALDIMLVDVRQQQEGGKTNSYKVAEFYYDLHKQDIELITLIQLNNQRIKTLRTPKS